MSETVSIVFKGELLPGFSLDEAKAHATLAFKLTPEKCDALFSGKPVTVRKGLPAAEVDAYLARMQRLGMRVEVRSDSAPASTPAATAMPNPAPALAATAAAAVAAEAPPANAAPAVEEISCPKCGEKQPRRTLCRNCAVDMPRFAAAQQQVEEDKRAEARAARDDARGTTPRSAMQRMAMDEERARFFALSFDERISRTTYILSCLAGFILGCLLAVIAVKGSIVAGMGVLLLCLLVLIVMLVWGVRMTMLRLHDLGWSGWWWLLSFVPVVGFLQWLVLMIMPGREESNDWGDRAPAASGVSVIVCGVAALLAFGLVMKTPGLDEVMKDTDVADARSAQGADDDTDLTSFDPQRNDIVLYSLSNCEACADKRQSLRAAGLRFTEHLVDQDQSKAQELAERLERAGMSGQTQLPVIVVNSKLLAGNPPVSEIARYLKR